LGYCHLLKSKDDIYGTDWEKAKKHLKNARNKLISMALPTDDVDIHLHSMEERERMIKKESAPEAATPKQWVLFLSPRRWQEFATAKEHDIDILTQPMGLGPLNGDQVFLMGEQPSHLSTQEATVRVLAVYQITSDPYWHPVDKYHNRLELVFRFQKPVRIAKNLLHTAEGGWESDLRQPSLGVFSLQSDSFKTLQNEIFEHYGADKKLAKVFTQEKAKKSRGRLSA
jgi:hypothetical protein